MYSGERLNVFLYIKVGELFHYFHFSKETCLIHVFFNYIKIFLSSLSFSFNLDFLVLCGNKYENHILFLKK